MVGWLLCNQIRIMKMLKHPNCIRILDVKENVPYTGTLCCPIVTLMIIIATIVIATCSIVVVCVINVLGIWCDSCACSSYRDSGDDDGTCSQCNHAAASHGDSPETRDVLLMVQELAAGGELFGLLMHCGPFPEEIARLYFRQLIEGHRHYIFSLSLYILNFIY
jgi:serine/threonine protein kinase